MRIAHWMGMMMVAALPSLGCVVVTQGPLEPLEPDTETPDAPNEQDALGVCPKLQGKTFASVEEGECGRSEDGVALCHWKLTFKAGAAGQTHFDWAHSDYGEEGTVACKGNTLTARSSFSPDRTYTGTYDAAQGKLVWDGVAYTVATP